MIKGCNLSLVNGSILQSIRPKAMIRTMHCQFWKFIDLTKILLVLIDYSYTDAARLTIFYLWWCVNDTCSVEIVLRILNFDLFLG